MAFKTEEDLKKALELDKCFMERRQIHVLKYVDRSKGTEQKPVSAYKDKEVAPEVIADVSNPRRKLPTTFKRCARCQRLRAFRDLNVIFQTGRLFIRNLPYTATEQELEDLLKPFGPIAELHLSIDSITKKPKGFAFVSFVFPEHALRALQALDYTTFHGRLMHIIPGLAKHEDPVTSKGSLLD